jgi:mono/diheme cytochrome c family protein
LTLVAAGSCTITASQPGNASFAAAATASNTFAVVATAAQAGKVAYNLEVTSTYNSPASCFGCHGAPGSVANSALLTAAGNPQALSAAITNNVGFMGMLTGKYSTQQIADIAAYLATPGI